MVDIKVVEEVFLTLNNFISVYQVLGEDDCNQLINWFESDITRHEPGETSNGVDIEVKKSTDIPCNFNSSESEKYNNIIIPALLDGKDAYVNSHPALSNIGEWQLDQEYNIQRYNDGEGYFGMHCEHSRVNSNRIMAWTLYLNDSESGTYYTEYDVTVLARQGNLCICPASWTHMHQGITPNVGTKYIATGWWSYVA